MKNNPADPNLKFRPLQSNDWQVTDPTGRIHFGNIELRANINQYVYVPPKLPQPNLAMTARTIADINSFMAGLNGQRLMDNIGIQGENPPIEMDIEDSDINEHYTTVEAILADCLPGNYSPNAEHWRLLVTKAANLAYRSGQLSPPQTETVTRLQILIVVQSREIHRRILASVVNGARLKKSAGGDILETDSVKYWYIPEWSEAKLDGHQYQEVWAIGPITSEMERRLPIIARGPNG